MNSIRTIELVFRVGIIIFSCGFVSTNLYLIQFFVNSSQTYNFLEIVAYTPGYWIHWLSNRTLRLVPKEIDLIVSSSVFLTVAYHYLVLYMLCALFLSAMYLILRRFKR